MAALRFDPEQRFTCRQCGRCCRRGWDISLTQGEVEAYRAANAERWYSKREEGPEGTEADPFEPIPGHPPYMRIRKRADGACGFLSRENRCRIHEEMGAAGKPLTCRLFPFRFHPADGPPLATASFCCPTVVANDGATLASQAKEMGRLQKVWSREYPEPTAEVVFASGCPLGGASLGTLRSILREMLDRPGEGGAPDLRPNVGRMARLMADLTRWRVLRLPPAAFAEYLELTGRYAARSDKPVQPSAPSRLGRLLLRGFLFVVAAARVQIEHGRSTGLRLGLRLRLARLLLHFHGFWAPVAGYDLPAARRARVALEDAAVRGLVHNYLRASLETLGTGRRPVFEELAVAVAFLDAAFVFAAMRAARASRALADASDLTEGLMEAVDLSHAPPGGLLSSLLGTLAAGVDALDLFAAGATL